MVRNSILKLEIELDKDVLATNGYDVVKSVNILCNGMKNAGLEKELVEEGHIIYRGTGSDNDLAYIMIVLDKMQKQKWIKDSCTKIDLWKEDKKTGKFISLGSYLDEAKARGMW